MLIESYVQNTMAGESDQLVHVSRLASFGVIPINSGAQEEEGHEEIGLSKANSFERGRTSDMCIMGTAGFLVPMSAQKRIM